MCEGKSVILISEQFSSIQKINLLPLGKKQTPRGKTNTSHPDQQFQTRELKFE
jgi:hypothetical protein